MLSGDIYTSWQKLQRQKFVEIKRHMGGLTQKIFEKKLVLDIGCGFGYLEKNFKGNFIGLDNDLTMLRGRVAVFPEVLGDGGNLPFKDNIFDTVVSIDAMHLVKKNDFIRVLKNEGFVLLSIFFNDENYEEKRSLLMKKLQDMKIIKEFDLLGREKEYVIIAVKK